MSRRALDAIVVGAGVVGAATALGLLRRGRRVALVESREPAPPSAAERDLRVYAIAPASVDLLRALGVWDAIRMRRAHPYRDMRVWDAGHAASVHFSADAIALDALGWIVEQAAITEALWRSLREASALVLRAPARVIGLEAGDTRVSVELDDGDTLSAPLLVAADGAASPLRTLAGIEASSRDYHQRAVVGYVRCTRSHQDTAWQRFLPGGPLALLPCSEGLGSFVWSLPEAEAESMLALDDAAFGDALTRAFEARLGEMRCASARAAFALRRQLAARYRAGRVVLVGDAAHVVHPLAGQGVNLGLRDVAELLEAVAPAGEARSDPGDARRLARWERRRRSDDTLAAYAFEGINRIFSNDSPLPLLLRGPALGLVDRIAPLKDFFIRHAIGRV